MDSVTRRAKESRKLLVAGVLINLVLALTKIAGGLFGHSNALIADGIESSLERLEFSDDVGRRKVCGASTR